MSEEELKETMRNLPAGSFILVAPEHPDDTRVEMSLFKDTDGCWYYVDEKKEGGNVRPDAWAHYATANQFIYHIH